MNKKFDEVIYYHYPVFEQELQEFIDKHTSSDYTAERVLQETENLLTRHFCKELVFTNNNCGLAPNTGAYNIYFFKSLVIANSNIGKKQQPKSYFLMLDHKIGFLCFGSHIENYKDEKLRKEAIKRAKELLPILGQL